MPVRQSTSASKHRGVICEVRRGSHADQGAPRAHGPHRPGRACAHIWFLKSLPIAPGPGSGHDAARHERVLYFEAYVVTDPGMTPLKEFSIMSEDDYDAKRKGTAMSSSPAWAPKASRTCSGIDLDTEIERLRGDLTGSEVKVKKNAKRLKVLEAFRSPASSPGG